MKKKLLLFLIPLLLLTGIASANINDDLNALLSDYEEYLLGQSEYIANQEAILGASKVCQKYGGTCQDSSAWTGIGTINSGDSPRNFTTFRI